MLKRLCCLSLVTGVALVAPAPAHAQSTGGLWISSSQLLALPTSGAAWNGLLSAANKTCGTPDLANQDDPANVCVMAKALVFARTGQSTYRQAVVTALTSIANSGTYTGRALALARELAAYVIAADLIDLKNVDPVLDQAFRAKLQTLRVTLTTDGPQNLIYCHEQRPNNWGTHCGASRAAVAAYLGDVVELDATARVFKGWLGDRASYASFSWGDTAWQCDPNQPVGINPAGCMRSGHSIDGVLPDDQRRTAGGFQWPAPKEGYVYEALQGALAQAIILQRAGYDDVFEWQDRALLRAFNWLYTQDGFPAEGDDTWQPYVINYFYGAVGANFPTSSPSQPGKNVGWTDWTFQGHAPVLTPPELSVSPLSLTFTAEQGGANPQTQFVQVANTGGGTLTFTASASTSLWTVMGASGTAPGSFGVTPSIGGLAAGTYQGTITVTAAGAQKSPTTVAVSLTVTAPQSQVRTMVPVADAWIRGGTYASKNYGTTRDLAVKDSSDVSFDRRTLVRFDVRGNAVTGATLKLFVTQLPNGAPVPVCVFATSDSWAETSVTWANQPPAQTSLGCITIKATGWVTLDVTAFVNQERNGDGFASFLLMDTSQANRMASFNSREASSNKPTLEIR